MVLYLRQDGVKRIEKSNLLLGSCRQIQEEASRGAAWMWVGPLHRFRPITTTFGRVLVQLEPLPGSFQFHF